MIRLLRPGQWTKNLLLFAALVFAERLFDPTALRLAMLGFVSFCLASSSVYVVNDLIDRERDRQHPQKRTRPIASGAVTPPAAVALALALTVAALGLAFTINLRFGMAATAYVSLTHFYSLVGKKVVILDVMLIATGFVIRAVAGALAIDVPYSDWFVLCTAFLALFIGLSKRKAEILAVGEGANLSRPVLQQYTAASLSVFTSASMAGALMSYALYVVDEVEKFSLLPATVPFVMFAVFRYHLLVESGVLGEKPEEVVLRDRPIQLCVIGFGAAALAALYATR